MRRTSSSGSAAAAGELKSANILARGSLLVGQSGLADSLAPTASALAWMAAVLPCLCDGGLFGTFIDWRGLPTVHSAADKLGLKPLNLIIWAKTNAGKGSLYRSQHELLPLFKKGSSSHVNNVELGKRCRWRSNVWTYPGASSLGSDARRGLQGSPDRQAGGDARGRAVGPKRPRRHRHRPVPRLRARPSSRPRKPVAYAVVSNSIRSTST